MDKNNQSETRQLSFFTDAQPIEQSQSPQGEAKKPFDNQTVADTFDYLEQENMPDAEIAPEHTVRPQRVNVTGVHVANKSKKKKFRSFFNFDYKNTNKKVY